MNSESPINDSRPGPNSAEEERRSVRRLQVMVDIVLHLLRQADLSLEEAKEMVANCRRTALAMFPDKEFTYDLIYTPRLQRVLAERFETGHGPSTARRDLW